MASFFAAHSGANQQHRSELLLRSSLKQPTDGGGVGVRRQCRLFLPRTPWCKAVGLVCYVTTCAGSFPPSRTLWGGPRVPCAPKKHKTNGRCRHKCSSQHMQPHGVTPACCSKAGPSFLAPTCDLTWSAICPHPRVPLGHSIPPFRTTAKVAKCLRLSRVMATLGPRPGDEVCLTPCYSLSPTEI